MLFLERISINRIVPDKVKKEYEEISRLGAGFFTHIEGQTPDTHAIEELRTGLRHKTIVRSDLLMILLLLPQTT